MRNSIRLAIIVATAVSIQYATAQQLVGEDQQPAEKSIINQESLTRFYRAAVKADFISGKDADFKLNASLYGIGKLMDRDLDYAESSFLRNFNVKVGFKQDDESVSEFSPGFTYALINHRDHAMYQWDRLPKGVKVPEDYPDNSKVDGQLLKSSASYFFPILIDSAYGQYGDEAIKSIEKAIQDIVSSDNMTPEDALKAARLEMELRHSKKRQKEVKESFKKWNGSDAFSDIDTEVQNLIKASIADTLIKSAIGPRVDNYFPFSSDHQAIIQRNHNGFDHLNDDYAELSDSIKAIVESEKYFVFKNETKLKKLKPVKKIIDRLSLLTVSGESDIKTHVTGLNFEAVFLRSLNTKKMDQKPWDLELKASYEMSNLTTGDSVIMKQNDILERQVAKASIGFNKVLMDRDFKRDGKTVTESMIEIKPFFEYEYVVAGRMLADLTDEDKENDEDEKVSKYNLGVTLKFRVAKDVFIPLEFKYDPESKKAHGFLSVSWNFSAS